MKAYPVRGQSNKKNKLAEKQRSEKLERPFRVAKPDNSSSDLPSIRFSSTTKYGSNVIIDAVLLAGFLD